MLHNFSDTVFQILDIWAQLFSRNFHCFAEPTGYLSHWAITKEPRTGSHTYGRKSRSVGRSGRDIPPALSQSSMELLSNGELNFTREGQMEVDSLVSVKVLPGMELAFDLMLLTPPERLDAPAAAIAESHVHLINPEVRLSFCSQEVGTHPRTILDKRGHGRFLLL